MTFGVAHMAQVIRIPEGGRLPFETDGVSPGHRDNEEVVAEIQSEMAVTRHSLEATAEITPGTEAAQEAMAGRRSPNGFNTARRPSRRFRT